MKLIPPCPRCGSAENPDSDRDETGRAYESCYECFIRDCDAHQQAMQALEYDALTQRADLAAKRQEAEDTEIADRLRRMREDV